MRESGNRSCTPKVELLAKQPELAIAVGDTE